MSCNSFHSKEKGGLVPEGVFKVQRIADAVCEKDFVR